MLFQQVSIAILGLAVATEAAIIPEVGGLSQMGLVRRQGRFGGGQGQQGQRAGGNAGNNANAGNANNANNANAAKTSAAAAAKTSAAAATNNNANANANANAGKNNAAAAGGASCLDPAVIQANSNQNGQATPVAGQANSATDANNFINFCKGQTVTNGLQVKAGSCNGIVMGKIPSTANMISSIITSPKPMEDLAVSQTFTVSVQTKGLAAGSFTNAQQTYYSAPQDLNGQGQVIGHTHFTIQDLGNSLQPSTAPDPVSFVFFKGVNDAGNNKGLLSATVTGGLPAGNYRVCTMTSSSNHQPVLMPVAQRGAQDDCQKFTVGAGTGNAAAGGNANAGKGNAGAAAAAGNANAGAAAAGNANAGKANGAATAASSTSAAAAATNKAGAGANKAGAGAGANKGGKGSVNSQAQSSAATPAAQANPNANSNSNAQSSPVSSAASQATGKASAQPATGTSASSGAALGGIAAPAVVDTGDKTRPFSVNGNTFVNAGAAKQRACAIQNNACSDAVNSGKIAGKTVGDCAAQETACNAA